MKKVLIIILTVLLSLSFFACDGGKEVPKDKIEEDFMYAEKEDVVTDSQLSLDAPVLFPDSLWQTPKSLAYPEGDIEGIQAYFLDSVSDTKIFAYVGFPKNASKTNKVPGIVLVHGGGGTAFYEWVKFWNDKGYAAIAMDTEGNMPVETSKMENNDHKKSIYKSGPSNTAFSDKNESVEKQWVYHALASIIVSTSFLSSFEQVDSTKVGVTGISYGGFLTCNVVGYDDRLAFASPVYGAIGNKGTDTAFGNLTSNDKTDIWDSTEILKLSRTPILFINSNTDFHFSVKATTDCFNASKFAEIVLVKDFLHSHVHGATQVPELYTFADNITLKKQGLPKVKVQPSANKTDFEVTLPKGVAIYEAECVYTTMTELKDTTTWKTRTAKVEGTKISLDNFPEDVTYFYYNIIFDNERSITTMVINK